MFFDDCHFTKTEICVGDIGLSKFTRTVTVFILFSNILLYKWFEVKFFTEPVKYFAFPIQNLWSFTSSSYFSIIFFLVLSFLFLFY